MINPQILPIFSKPIFIDHIEFNKTFVLNMFEKESFKKIWKGNNLCKTSENKFILNKKELQFLKEKIFESFNKYVKGVLKYDYNDFKMTTSWITKTKFNENSLIHNHNNSMFSGVLYLKTLPKKAKIIFHNHSNSSHWDLRTSENNIYNSNKQTFDMSENLIIFFPSEVYHEIKLSEQDERISLAFNFCPTGKIGQINSDSYMEIQ